jgi:Uma2 family endonuclease
MNIRFQPPVRTIADLLHRLGDIPAGRVRYTPVPGIATVEDLLRPENKGCELVNDTLVERPRNFGNSILAIFLASLLDRPIRCQNLGILTGPFGTFEILSGLVRLPDVAFFSWDRLPGRRVPNEPVPKIVPDLVVEVLSSGNTLGEMARKRDEYFGVGVRLVWEIDPRVRTVRLYTGIDQFRDLTATDTLTGDPVLPGFTVPLAQLFAELDRHG